MSRKQKDRGSAPVREVAPVLVLQALYPVDRGCAPVLGHPRAAVGTKKAGEVRAFSGLKRGRKRKVAKLEEVSGPAAPVA